MSSMEIFLDNFFVSINLCDACEPEIDDRNGASEACSLVHSTVPKEEISFWLMYINEFVYCMVSTQFTLGLAPCWGEALHRDCCSCLWGLPFQIYMYQFWVVFFFLFLFVGFHFLCRWPWRLFPEFGSWKEMCGIAVRSRAIADRRVYHWKYLSAEVNTRGHLLYKLIRGCVSWSKFRRGVGIQENNSPTEDLRFSCSPNNPRFLRCVYEHQAAILSHMEVRGGGIWPLYLILRENSWVALINAQHYAQDTLCVFMGWPKPPVTCIGWLRLGQICFPVWICGHLCLKWRDCNSVRVLILSTANFDWSGGWFVTIDWVHYGFFFCW